MKRSAVISVQVSFKRLSAIGRAAHEKVQVAIAIIIDPRYAANDVREIVAVVYEDTVVVSVDLGVYLQIVRIGLAAHRKIKVSIVIKIAPNDISFGTKCE